MFVHGCDYSLMLVALLADCLCNYDICAAMEHILLMLVFVEVVQNDEVVQSLGRFIGGSVIMYPTGLANDLYDLMMA